jgi:hypothetical protein
VNKTISFYLHRVKYFPARIGLKVKLQPFVSGEIMQHTVGMPFMESKIGRQIP